MLEMLERRLNQPPNQPPPEIVLARINGGMAVLALVGASSGISLAYTSGRCSAEIPVEARIKGPAIDLRRNNGLGLAWSSIAQ